jgi:hypothetical protein
LGQSRVGEPGSGYRGIMLGVIGFCAYLASGFVSLGVGS